MMNKKASLSDVQNAVHECKGLASGIGTGWYGGPVGRAREQCTQILETVDAAQPNSRRSAAKQSTECTSTK